jgi:hypothetical protein
LGAASGNHPPRTGGINPWYVEIGVALSGRQKRLFAFVVAGAALAVFAGLAAAAVGHDSATPTLTAQDEVVVCHSNGPGSWVQQSPSVDGVLSGHAEHPNDIIPPFDYQGGPFPGLNWDPEGQAIYKNGCVLPAPRPEPIGVFGSCVSTSGGTYTAVFGYNSANAADVTIPVGAANGFSPGEVNRGQVEVFQHGTVMSAFTVTGIPQAEDLRWTVSYAGQTSHADVSFAGCGVDPPPAEPHVTISVTCVPNGPTTFDAVFGYSNGGQAIVNVPIGSANNVSPGGPNRGQPENFPPGTVTDAFTVRGVPNGTSLVWTLTSGGSTATATASASASEACGGGQPIPAFPVSVSIKCVENHDSTYDATFGYSNPNTDPATQQIGPANSVSPGGPGRGQPETFQPGVVASAFTLTGIPANEAAAWTLSTVPPATSTATATSSLTPKCSDPPEVPALGIFVRCVSNRGGTFAATFGYQNDNLRPVTIPVGENNRFLPAPSDRGQTTNFQPGNVQEAFTVSGIPAGQVLVWFVTSSGVERQAAASAAFETKCSEPPPPAKPIGLFVTCIDKHDSTYDATFGYENDNGVAETIPIGDANFFSPAPVDRGQPTTFAPGRNAHAITVHGVPANSQLTWTLAYAGTRTALATIGSSATATASTPSCQPTPPTPPEPPGPKPPEPSRPLGIFAACVLNNGTTYDAVFGYGNLNVGDVAVPIGARNRVRPGEIDQGQPETFRPGLVIAAFAVRAVPVGRPVSWQVTFGDETRVAIATASLTQKCETTPIIGLADLSVTKRSKPAAVRVRDRVVFTIVAKNIGRRPMTPVVITDFFRDDRVEVRSMATTLGTCRLLTSTSRQVVSCGRGTLAPGESATVQIAGRAVASGCSRDYATTIFSRIADPTPRNNVARARVCIRAPVAVAGRRAKPRFTG